MSHGGGGGHFCDPYILNLPTHPDLLNVYCGYVASLLQERELFVYCFQRDFKKKGTVYKTGRYEGLSKSS